MRVERRTPIAGLFGRLRLQAIKAAHARAQRATASQARTSHAWRHAETVWPDLFQDG